MHRSYNSYTPVASKLLQKRWDDRSYDRHRRHLHSSRPEIDSNPPITFMHLHLKLKKLQLEEERLATIERDNRILLEKMAHIMRTRGQIDNRNDVEFKSLSKGRRDREMLRIAKENVHMVKRIHSKKSELSVDKLERDWVQNLKFMDNISAFPEDWYLRKREERRHSDPAINETGRSRSSSPRKSQRGDKSKTAGKKRSDSRSDSDNEKSKEKSRPKEKKEEKKEEKKKEDPPSKIETAIKHTQKEDKKEEKREEKSKPAAAKETKKDQKDETTPPSRMDSVFKNLQKDDSQPNRKDSKDSKTNKDRKESSPSSDKKNVDKKNSKA